MADVLVERAPYLAPHSNAARRERTSSITPATPEKGMSRSFTHTGGLLTALADSSSVRDFENAALLTPSRSCAASTSCPSSPSASRRQEAARLWPPEPATAESKRSISGSSSMMTLSTQTQDPSLERSPGGGSHSRSKSLTQSMSAGAKTLARKASGKLRSLGSSSKQQNEMLPRIPGPVEQGDARRAADKVDMLEVADPGCASASSSDGEMAASPSTSTVINSATSLGNQSPHSIKTTASRKKSGTRLKSLPRSVSEVDVETAKPSKDRTSLPSSIFKRQQNDGDEPARRKSLSRKKSSPSLLPSTSSSSIFHLGKQHQPTVPPLITPFVIEVQETVHQGGKSALPAGASLEWPPKRQSSMPGRSETSDASTAPSLATSLATLSQLSTPAERASNDGPKLRFPASFGFVTRPGEEVPPIPELPDLAMLKPKLSPHPMSVDLKSEPSTPERARTKTRKPMDFESLLDDDSVMIRKTLTPGMATRTKT